MFATPYRVNWFGPIFTDLDVFLLLPFSIEMMFPEQALSRVSLVVASAIWTLEWIGHGSPFLVSSHGGFVFLLALQHYSNLRWFSNLWGLLHLTYFDPWILQEKVECSHLQQFLHWGTPGLALVPLIVAMNDLTLKYLLIKSLAFVLLCTSHISIHTMAMSDFGETLMTLGFDTRVTLLKMWFCLMMLSTSEELRRS